MRVFIAIVMGVLIAGVGVAMIRGLSRPAPSPKPEDAVPVLPNAPVRTMYWCETCGTELLLLRKGTDAAPRHCGESMIKREEIPHF
jgi:DNA-directed RNA polymerase subunit RPC12/RpoP